MIPAATSLAGSAIRAEDLNDNNAHIIQDAAQERKGRDFDSTGGTITGDVVLQDSDLIFAQELRVQ